MFSTPSPAAMIKKHMEELSNKLGALQAGITSLSLSTNAWPVGAVAP